MKTLFVLFALLFAVTANAQPWGWWQVPTTNGVIIGNGSNPVNWTTAGTTGQVLIGNTGTAPSWGFATNSFLGADSASTTDSLIKTGLSFSMGASDVWQCDVYITDTTTDAVNGIKFGWQLPTGATIKGHCIGSKKADTLDYARITDTTAVGPFTLAKGSNVYGVFEAHVVIRNGSSNGTVYFLYQKPTTGQAVLKKDSYLVVRRFQ